jgi:formyl-CoA transferase
MTINHPEIGEFELVGAPWKMSDCETPAVHAPLLGEHNEYVFKGLLGLSDEEIDDLRNREIIM